MDQENNFEESKIDSNRLVHIAVKDRKEHPFRHTIRVFLNAFAAAYGIRGGISLVLHMINIARKNPKDLFSIENLVGEHNFRVRVQSVRWALFVGVFFGGFEGK